MSSFQPFNDAGAHLAALIESSDDAILSKSLDGIIKSWNPAAQRIFGYTAEEAVGKHITLIIPEERRGEEELIISKLKAGDRVEHFDTIRRRKDGKLINLSLTISPIRNEAGVVVGASKIARDITERKQIEKALRESEERFRILSDLDEATRYLGNPLEVTDAVTRILVTKFSADHCVYADIAADQDTFMVRHDYGRSGKKTIEGSFRLDMFGHGLADRLRHGETIILQDVEKELPTKSGRVMLLSLGARSIICCPLIKEGALLSTLILFYENSRVWSDAQVRVFEVVAQRCWDYIERAYVSEKLRNNEKYFRELANAMPQVVWSANKQGEVDFVNDRFNSYSGLVTRDGEIVNWEEIIHPDDVALTGQVWSESIRSGSFYEREQRIYHLASNEFRWNLTRAAPVRNENGEIVKWFGTNTDIEDRKRFQLELEEAKNRAEAANIAKTEFLANMSHEIRTPMNAIIGLANILALNSSLSPKQKDLVKTLQMSASSLLTLINDLLDISKIEVHTLELEEIPFNMTQLMQEVISMMSVRATEKGLNFNLNARDLETRVFIGDPTRLRQIIVNLCSNAIKFTEQGSIEVRISCRDIDADREEICIEIEDTGIGIPAEKLDTIFQKFVQADTSINRRYGGTGLGLAIVKTLTEIMGGNISVESVSGKGSIFRTCLPFKKFTSEMNMTEKKAVASFYPRQNKRILLVEDYAPNVMVAEHFLDEFGYDCEVASSGVEAVEMARNRTYNAILMDVQMHGMNGFEATSLIRDWEKKQNFPRTPIIGMTAHALAGDRMRCIAAGMDDYITKPFDPEELRDILIKALQGDAVSSA